MARTLHEGVGMKTLRDPKWNPHKNDAYRLADGRTIEVVRRQKSGPLGLFSLEDTIVFQDAFGGGEERKGGRLALGLFQALVRRAVVVRAKGVPDATKVRTVARVHFTRPCSVSQEEYNEVKTVTRDAPDAYGNFHGYQAGVVVQAEADGSLSLYLAPRAFAPAVLLRGVPADAVRFDELE